MRLSLSGHAYLCLLILFAAPQFSCHQKKDAKAKHQEPAAPGVARLSSQVRTDALPPAILANLSESFFCDSGHPDEGFVLVHLRGGKVEVDYGDRSGNFGTIDGEGSYAIDGDRLQLTVDGSSEASSNMQYERGALLSFSLPSFKLCHAVALDRGGVKGRFACPSFNFIKGSNGQPSSFQKSTFTLEPNGGVYWLHTLAITPGTGSDGDEIYSYRNGIYFLENGVLTMIFANRSDDRTLTAQVDANQDAFTIQQLAGAADVGPCTP